MSEREEVEEEHVIGFYPFLTTASFRFLWQGCLKENLGFISESTTTYLPFRRHTSLDMDRGS